MSYKLIIFVGLSCIFSNASGMYFYLQENGKKCFREDTPSDTMVVGMVTAVVLDRTYYRKRTSHTLPLAFESI